MNVIELILASMGVSLDVFAVTVWKGANYANLDKNKTLKISLLFSGMQCLFLLLGNIFTAIPLFRHRHLSLLNSLAGIIIFFALGFLMLYKAFPKSILQEHRESYSYKQLLILAVIASVDSLILGFGYGLLYTRILPALLVMFIVTTLCAVLGLQSGYRLGFKHRNGAYILGFVILIIIGIETLYSTFH